jgi:hypothetical protein
MIEHNLKMQRSLVCAGSRGECGGTKYILYIKFVQQPCGARENICHKREKTSQVIVQWREILATYVRSKYPNRFVKVTWVGSAVLGVWICFVEVQSGLHEI